MSNTCEGEMKFAALLLAIVMAILASGLIGCASTTIQPDGKGNYQAIMESTTVMGIGTDYANRVNGEMKVNRATKVELDQAVEQYGGGELR